METTDKRLPVWGILRPASVYHSAPNCPEILDRITRTISKPIKYANEDEAFKAGHLSMCGMCRKGVLIEYEEELYMRLTVEQISTIRIIKSVHDRTKTPLTLSQIATERKRKISTCFMLVNGLVRKGLVRKIYGKRGKKAVNRSIVPTELATKVLAKLNA